VSGVRLFSSLSTDLVVTQPLLQKGSDIHLPDMGLPADFDDRQTQIESEADAYHPYEYQTENNSSWAGALPVKQYVPTETKSSNVKGR
jgi:hypothetical protein